LTATKELPIDRRLLLESRLLVAVSEHHEKQSQVGVRDQRHGEPWFRKRPSRTLLRGESQDDVIKRYPTQTFRWENPFGVGLDNGIDERASRGSNSQKQRKKKVLALENTPSDGKLTAKFRTLGHLRKKKRAAENEFYPFCEQS
jgi:hypothetical protein